MKPHDLKLRRDKTNGQSALLHRPAEVAKILRCSEWWVKEQARKERIPFAWIGGSYRFTDEHIVEIVRLFERRPASGALPSREASVPGPNRSESSSPPPAQLRARRPRRSRNVDGRSSLAA
ncbi:helix-turn-helix domain-containing protein [Polymorphospora sp. NPDC051019]|uniref:helix-turn-helix domain-containing protein n=1 Tax=Polymorphospora sp. NPDC051019 TaxID=3155725 RepID=UPI00343D8148